jgi:hypothetical protein
MKKILFFYLILWSCDSPTPKKPPSMPFVQPPTQENSRFRLPKFYRNSPPPTLPTLKPGIEFSQAVNHSISFLKENQHPQKHRLLGNVREKDLLELLYKLQNGVIIDPIFLANYVEFHELKTNLPDGKSRMTGYFTPIFRAANKKTDRFSTAIFKDSGKPLAWVRNKKVSREIQIQGSCYLDFGGGDLQQIGWDGEKDFDKIKLDFQADSTELTISTEDLPERDGKTKVFFKKINSGPLGAINQPLTPAISVSCDPRIAPLGSVLLAQIDDFSSKKNPKLYRLLLVQDVGGNILGSGRIDMYCGVGAIYSPAVRTNDHIKLWLLLPK